MDLNNLSQSFSAGTLIASLIWGTVGFGFFVYGKKQRSAPPLFGGVAMMGVSYFISSPAWLTVASLAIIGGIWFWSRM